MKTTLSIVAIVLMGATMIYNVVSIRAYRAYIKETQKEEQRKKEEESQLGLFQALSDENGDYPLVVNRPEEKTITVYSENIEKAGYSLIVTGTNAEEGK